MEKTSPLSPVRGQLERFEGTATMIVNESWTIIDSDETKDLSFLYYTIYI